jgi:hypothetical protein
LQPVSDEDLVAARLMLLGYAGEGLVVCFVVPNKRTVLLHYDTVILTISDNFTLLTPWVEL